MNAGADKKTWAGPLLALLAVCAFCAWFEGMAPLNNDSGFFLESARRLLAGERQYTDIQHANLPYISFYAMLPVLLSQVTGLSAISLFTSGCSLLFTICAAFTLRILLTDPAWRNMLRAYGLAIALPVLIFLVGEPYAIFGQREQLFSALFLPYVACSLQWLQQREQGRKTRIAAGLMALAGCIIKPHFFIIFALMELALSVMLRSAKTLRRAECLMVGIGSLAAYAAVPLAYPDYLATAKRMHEIYAGYEIAWGEYFQTSMKIWGPDIFLTLLMLGVPLLLRVKPTKETLYLACGVAAGFASYLLHKAGFMYQMVSARLFFLLLCLYVLRRINEKDRYGICFIAGVTALLAFAARPAEAVYKLPQRSLATLHIHHAMSELDQRFHGKSVMLLSTNIWPGYPEINYAGMHDVAHLSLLFYVPVFYISQNYSDKEASYHTPETMSETERYFYNQTIDDIVTRKPDMLMVDLSPEKFRLYGQRFDIIRYFSQDARFAEAFSHYHEVSMQALAHAFAVPSPAIFERTTP